MSSSLFIYGTLLAPEVLRLLVPREVLQQRALLRGYVRRRLHGRVFPGIEPRHGEEIEGVLLECLTRGEMQRLDDFEGDLYQRTGCLVETEDGDAEAFVYVIRSESSGRLAPEPWDYEAFLANDFADYLVGCQRYAKTLGPLP